MFQSWLHALQPQKAAPPGLGEAPGERWAQRAGIWAGSVGQQGCIVTQVQLTHFGF